MHLDLQTLKQTVQKNCHIADANSAGNYTLCVYLLKMREFYRWENGYNFGDNIPREEVGNWLREREALWEDLQDADYEKIPLNDQVFDPFDSHSINQTLQDQHLVYSAGLGHDNAAHFFLGVLERRERHNDFEIIVVADEYARDLTAPPAMSQGKTIYIRREAFYRLMWEKYEQWLWNRPENAMGRALAFYPFETDLDDALEQLTQNELNAAVLHEIGEAMAHTVLGDAWEDLLITLPHSKLALMLRAIRDHYADTLSTLPALLEQENAASIHFYFGNLTNMRKDLFPSLMMAYQHWHEQGDLNALRKLARAGKDHWESVCRGVLEIAQTSPENLHARLTDFIESNRR
ncbi:MAG: hypothetical protein GC149_17150 [Gammaproteobacteria bacterium]|nr:hypothetical protein [Gammaproteobacteria bacterium]